jgi:hypothetical protein
MVSLSNLEDASFRTFGRPKEPDKRRVDPELSQIVAQMEVKLSAVRAYIMGDDVVMAQYESRQLEGLHVMLRRRMDTLTAGE